MPNLNTATKERVEKNCVVPPFCSHKYHKIGRKKEFLTWRRNFFLAIFLRMIEFFDPKIVTKLSKI
jgi:hypothetical protein